MTRLSLGLACLGVMIINRSGLVIALERADVSGSWQAPQGGIRPDEEPFAAVPRELREESGVDASQVTLIEEYARWLAYELPREAPRRR